MKAPRDQTAKTLAAWEEAAPSYDRQIAFFERALVRGAGMRTAPSPWRRHSMHPSCE